MIRVRHDLITRIWRGRDPFLDLPYSVQEVDLDGSPGEHPYLTEAIASVLPRFVVEVGAARGGTAIVLARELKSRRVNGVVIAVDTFLGGAAEWQSDAAFDALGFEAGHATLYGRFSNNVMRFGLGNYILPLTLDSTSAASLLQHLGVHPGVVHLDTALDYHGLTGQLHAWWSVLAPGGILIGSNYDAAAGHADAKRAFDDFFAAHGHAAVEHRDGKCRITKTEHAVSGAPESAAAARPPSTAEAPPVAVPHMPAQEATPAWPSHADPVAAEPVPAEPAQSGTVEQAPALAATAPAEPALGEPARDEPTVALPDIEKVPARRATGSFRLGGRPVQLSDEQESASAS